MPFSSLDALIPETFWMDLLSALARNPFMHQANATNEQNSKRTENDPGWYVQTGEQGRGEC
jgi:hypothetical protein